MSLISSATAANWRRLNVNADHISYSGQPRNTETNADGRPSESQIHINDNDYTSFDPYKTADINAVTAKLDALANRPADS